MGRLRYGSREEPANLSPPLYTPNELEHYVSEGVYYYPEIQVQVSYRRL